MSKSGLSAYSAAAFPTTTPAVLSTSEVGIAVPAPVTPYSVADFKGTWNVVSFNQATTANYWGTGVTQIVSDGSGKASHYSCSSDGTVCSTTADMTATITGPDATGVFTFTGSDGSVRKLAVYRSANGDMVAFGVLSTSSSTMVGEFFVANQRLNTQTMRTVGSSYTTDVWLISNSGTASGTAGLVQTALLSIYTVTAVTSNPYTWTRYAGTDTLAVDTVQANVPRVGMLSCAATTAVAGVEDGTRPALVMVGGIGWAAFVTTSSGAPNSTNTAYYGITITQPPQ